MSDVTVAPDATPSPAPAPSEVVVNPTPTSIPTPLSSQAPTNSAPGPDFKGSEHRPQSRREAIQQAFERAEKAKDAKPADAKIGHNRPPEATAKEKPKVEAKAQPKFDLRKRPAADAPTKDDEPRPRAEHGHFARRETPAGADIGRTVEPGPQQQADPAQQRAQAVNWGDPLPRMTEAAKKDWASTPPTVRAEVHRLNNEYGRAFKAYKADHETMNSIRHYHQQAAKQGTTLRQVIDSYHDIERSLREDPMATFERVTNNIDLRFDDGTPQGRKITFGDICWAYVNQTPEQQALVRSRSEATKTATQLAQAQQRIAALEQQNKQVQYERAFIQQRGGVDDFAKSHPRVDELGDLIAQEIRFGFPLDEAYRRAELLRPASTAPQTRTTAAQTRTTTAQTRPADRSISGAPGGPSNGNGVAKPREPVGRREAIAAAIRQVNGSI